MDGLIHISTGGPMRKIVVDGTTYHFEMHNYCGPMLCRADGEPDNRNPPVKFLKAVSLWAQQGQRLDGDVAVWAPVKNFG